MKAPKWTPYWHNCQRCGYEWGSYQASVKKCPECQKPLQTGMQRDRGALKRQIRSYVEDDDNLN